MLKVFKQGVTVFCGARGWFEEEPGDRETKKKAITLVPMSGEV